MTVHNPMRVLFCTTGGLGHLLPLWPLAAALRDRGHRVAWVTAPDALRQLEGRGIDLFAAGPTFEASRHEFRATHAAAAQLTGELLSAFTFPRLFGAVLAPAMLEALDAAVRSWHPDVVVHEPAALAAPLVCRQLGLPNVVHGYGLWPPAGYLESAMTFFGPHWRARGLRAPVDGGLYQHLQLDIVPASLQPPSALADGNLFRFNPHRARDAGPPLLPVDLRDAWQGARSLRPRIYVTFGTVFNRSPALVAAVGAAARAGGSVVVTTGAQGDWRELAAAGPHLQVRRFVDQSALLPHCDLVVSHGGAGTLLGAAAHGVPQLVLPQAADHFRNARALLRVGGGRVIEPGRQTLDVVAAALAGMFEDPAIVHGAKRLAREMAALPDAAMAASRLEQWLACTPGGQSRQSG